MAYIWLPERKSQKNHEKKNRNRKFSTVSGHEIDLGKKRQLHLSIPEIGNWKIQKFQEFT